MTMTIPEAEEAIRDLRRQLNRDIEAVQTDRNLNWNGRKAELERIYNIARGKYDLLMKERRRMIESDLSYYRTKAIGGSMTPERRELVRQIYTILAKGGAGKDELERELKRAARGDTELTSALAQVGIEMAEDEEAPNGSLLLAVGDFDAKTKNYAEMQLHYGTLRDKRRKVQEMMEVGFENPPYPAPEPRSPIVEG